MKDVFAYTQYCDDVRREIDGRPSLMGIFPNAAAVDVDSDNILPRLCAYTVINLPTKLELESIVVISAWEKDEVKRVEIPPEAIEDFNRRKEEDGGDQLKLSIATMIEILNLNIGTGGVLRTQVLINGSAVDTRALRLQPASVEAA